MQAVHRHACTCSHTTHAAYHPFAAESLGSGRHGCATCSLLYQSLSVGPTDNADRPTSPQMRPFPPKQEAENIHTISHVLLSQFFVIPVFFLFHRRTLRFQPIRHEVQRTRQTVLRACRAKRFGTEHSFVAVHGTAQIRFAK